MSLSRKWLAAFKMMHRSVGRQGCGQLLAAFAALTDRKRSRQNFPSALRAPLTLPRSLLFSTATHKRGITMNTVTITGRFTADPELKFTTGAGKAVTTVRVAINEQSRDKAVFIDLQSWEKTAEFIASYGTKGRLFEATARLALDQWTDTEGSQHSKHYLVTGPYQFRFLDKSSDGSEPEAPAEDA
jgi:single-strand DNA-binding protein